MPRIHLSFTEHRRRKLALKVDRIDRLESRSTVTPFTAFSLATGAFQGLSQLGMMQSGGSGNALSGPVQPDVTAQGAISQSRAVRPQARGASGDFLPINIVPAPSSAAGGGAPAAQEVAAPARAKAPADDELTKALAPNFDTSSSQTGISAPWKPASRPGGGAALPPRGGSGNGAQAATMALVQGHSAPLPATPPPTAPPVFPGILNGGGPRANPAANLPGPVITRNAPAQRLNPGTSPVVTAAPGGGLNGGVSPADAPTGPSIIPENPSSLPSSTVGNGPGFAPLTFQYFPLYIVDDNEGVVLFNNQYQLGNEGGTVDLYAQVKNTTVSTYSWTVNGATGITGASTYHVHFQWQNSAQNVTNAVTLTVTNSSSQQESQTVYFSVLTSSVTLPTSASWPVTLPPDLVEPGAPSIPSQNVSVDADSGALDSSIPLPSYNPNVPALALTYNSMTADPRPIVVVHHQLDPSQAVPTAVNATLTFNSSAGTTWYYNTSQFIAGDIQQIALQANATSLSTGRYAYSVQLVDERSTNTTTTYNGTATVLNESTSPFGDGWTLQGLEQVTSASGGVILGLGDNGESLWFSGSPGVGGNYTSPAGDFSTLTKTSGGYTRTLTDGTQTTFNSSGYETATIDLNGLHTTYAFNGSNQLVTITDPYNNATTFTYSSGTLSTIQDPALRLTTLTFTGSDLTAVQQADGSRVTYTYDSAGRMTQAQDPLSHVVSIAYDSAERVSTITRPDGTTQLISSDQEQGWTNSGTSGSPAAATLLAEAATTYTTPNGNSYQTRPDWMGLGQLSQATDPYGNVTTNDLNSNALPIVTVDGLNRITQRTFDSLGNPVTITYQDATSDHFTYNSDSEPLTHTDGNGHTTSYAYDSHGNLTGIQDPLNNRTTLTYTANGRVQSVTDANNHTTSYQYDSQDRATTIQFPDGTTNLDAYNSQGNVIKFTDGRNNVTTYAYDSLNRMTGTTDALSNRTTYVYDAAGNLTQEQDPTPAGSAARTTTYAYDSMNRVTTSTDALGHATVYKYDSDGNVTKVTDPLSRITTYQYDEMDRRTVTIDPMGNATTVAFDADGEELTVTDPLNRTATMTYSVRGWVATETDALGNIVTYTYSATGKQLGQYQNQYSHQIVQLDYYDADDRLTTMIDGMNNTTTIGYDGVGNRVSVTDPNGNTVTSVYDSRNRLVETIEPLGVTVSYTYDGSGNLQTATDALGHTTTTLYDALDRATTLISAVGGITTIVYDAASREVSLKDPAGNITTWMYDAADRVTTVVEPNGSTVTSVYDADNELTDTTDQDGRRTTYSYDADGDETGETWVGASPSEKITYTYDADHEMTGAADSYATLTFTYDNDGRLSTAATSGPGTGQPTVTLTYGYDQVGDETSVSDSLSSQGLISYTYDSDQRLTQITTTYGGTAGPQISFGYDNGSRLTSTSRQIGNSGNPTQVNTTITYDAANRVVTVTEWSNTYNMYSTWTAASLATQVYSYDNASRVTSEQDQEGTASFTYDNANELTAVTGSRSESYSYDLNGNRNSSGYTTGTNNELTASPGYTYTYDNAGNMLSQTNTSTHVTTSYTYDYRNRLTNVTTGGTAVATYTYDALNRRIGIKESGTQTWTVYDGASADAHPYADFNGSGSLTTRYLFGPGAINGTVGSVILARTSSGGTTAWYLTDKLGSVRDIVNTSGTLLDHIVYDSFGNIVSETNATNGDRFKFAGMQFDSAMGQYYDHARWYGSGAGRFLSQDPAGFSAGDTNLYRYVHNDPMDGTDASGLIGPDSTQMMPQFYTAMAAMAASLTMIETGIGSAIEAVVALSGVSLAAAAAAAAPGACWVAIAAESAYATYLIGSLAYHSVQYGAAVYAGWALDAQLEVSRGLLDRKLYIAAAAPFYNTLNADILNFEQERARMLVEYLRERDAWYESGGQSPTPNKPPGWDMKRYLEYIEKFIARVTGEPQQPPRPWQRP